MARSLYKVPFVNVFYFENRIKKKKIQNLDFYLADPKRKISQNLFFFKRNSAITKFLLGQRVCIHNGFYFPELTLQNDSIGFKLGEFSTPRKHPKHKGK